MQDVQCWISSRIDPEQSTKTGFDKRHDSHAAKTCRYYFDPVSMPFQKLELEPIKPYAVHRHIAIHTGETVRRLDQAQQSTCWHHQ